VLDAALWGFVASSALLAGALVGVFWRAPGRALGIVAGFGAGALVSALAFDLTREAYDRAGGTEVTLGLLAGAAAFYAGDLWLTLRGAGERKRSGGQMAGAAGSALLLGALLDGIPESVALGATLLEGGEVGLAFVAAVFVSNFPEALSSSTGMRRAGHTRARILGTWAAVVAASALASALGYGLLDGVSPGVLAFVQAFAAGAILCMLADTLFPEAYEEAGPLVGLVTAAGFAVAFALSAAD
jgi:zinc transporter, ZIP family